MNDKKAQIAKENANREKHLNDLQKQRSEKEQLRKELKEIKKQLNESRSKEMKSIDKKKLALIIKYAVANPGNNPIEFVLNSLTQFIVGSKNATFTGNKAEHFDNVDNLHEALRSIKPDALNFEEVKDIMLKIGGKDGSAGEIINQLTDENNRKIYIEFYPYFKTLSKICHWSMNCQKDTYAATKIANLNYKINDF